MTFRFKEPIFIVGMARSGTTLLKSILNSHPSITVPRETAYFNLIEIYKKKHQVKFNKINYEDFWQWYIKNRRFTYLGIKEDDVRKNINKNDFNIQSIFDSVMYTFMLTQGKTRWAEKTPGHELYLDEILTFYPSAKIIYILRDPRAVYNSLKNIEWNKNQFISVIIKRWNKSIDVIKKYEDDDRFKLITYEDLVNKTEESIKSICYFIDEEYNKDMIFNRKNEFTPTENLDLISSVSHEKSFSKRNIDSKSLFKWRNSLTQFEISIIETFSNQEIFNKYYNKSDNKLRLFELIKYNYLKVIYYSKYSLKSVIQIKRRIK